MPTTKPTADFEYSDEELLKLYREAYAVVAIKGKSYTLGGGNGRTFTAHDLSEIREQIEYLENKVQSASGMAVNLARLRS